MQVAAKPRKILLVEDNPGEIRLIKESFAEVQLDTQLNVVKDGVEALEYLRKEGSFSEAESPDLFLLDLTLPRKNGFEVLEEIKDDDRLKHLPVVILTTSQDEEDILRTYRLQASCYIAKPDGLPGYVKVAKSLEIFWLTVATLPQ